MRESHWASGQMPYGRSRGQSWKNESFHQIEWLIIICLLSWFADGPNWRPKGNPTASPKMLQTWPCARESAQNRITFESVINLTYLARSRLLYMSKLDSLCKPQFTARDDTMHSTREGLLNQQRVRALNIENYYWFASAPSLNRLFYRFQVSLLLNACAPSDSRFYGRVSNLRPNANTPKGHGRGV